VYAVFCVRKPEFLHAKSGALHLEPTDLRA